jgi:hypothetical protein
VTGPERGAGPETAFAGRYDPLEMPIILEVLRERGIFAVTKASLEETEPGAYPFMSEGRGVLLVDRARLAEARRLIAEEVPARLAELRAGLAEEPEPPLDEDLVPLGWFSPEVARALLDLLAQAEVRAAPEYPLDRPPPPYARADGRVRVHVEAGLEDLARRIVAEDLPAELAGRGVAWREPLLGEDE